jgi:tRNA 5-methylaminomethyl-2-thiouridine biosynthesis bifunctional protein
MLQTGRLEFSPEGMPFPAGGKENFHPAEANPSAARQVFLAGNRLPERWQGRDRFVIIDTQFGLGLNFLATWQAWRDDPQRCRRLHIVAFDARPFSAADLARAHQAWPAFADISAQLRAAWPPLLPGMHRLFFADHQITLTLVFADPAKALRTVNASADAFFLSRPGPGQTLASPNICRALARLAAPGATLAAPGVDAALLAALSAAEFDLATPTVEATADPILTGHFRSRRPQRHQAPQDRRAIVIGAGIAGCTTAHRLAVAGWQVELIEQDKRPGQGASGNLTGMLRPLPSADDNRLSRLTRAGFLATRRLLQTLPGARWADCGVIHLARDGEHEISQQRAVAALGWPADQLQFVDRTQASALLNWPVERGGWWLPSAGWVQPASLCHATIDAFPARIHFRPDVAVDRLNRTKTGWQALAGDGSIIASAPVLVMASGTAATRFAEFAWLPQGSDRGQVSHLPAAASASLGMVLFGQGYALPPVDGITLIGATHALDDPDPGERLSDHQENLTRLETRLSGFTTGIAAQQLHGRTGFRPISPDRLPMVGPVPIPDSQARCRPHQQPRIPGLWCVQGFGARGIVWSALMADLLVSRIEGDPWPIETELANAVDPARFISSGNQPGEEEPQDDV